MDMRIVNGALTGLPHEHTTLFLAKMVIEGNRCFAAVFGPSATCLPQNSHTDVELHDAQVGVFDETGILSSIHSVRGGEKYIEGGGVVYLEGTGEAILWTTPDERGRCRIFGERIHPRDVLIAL